MNYIIITLPLIVGGLFLISPKKKGLRILFNLLKGIGSLVLVLFLLRLHWFDIYKIPSPSMEQTLMVGDKIIIRKGALPKHNDIAVFQMKHWKNQMIIVKRCIGLPGDSIEMRLDSVFVNGNYVEELPTQQWNYIIDSLTISAYQLDSMVGRKTPLWKGKKHQFTTLNNTECDKLRNTCESKAIVRATQGKKHRTKVFPKNKLIPNNWSNLQHFYIPQKGDSIPMNKYNTAMYFNIIKQETSDAKRKNNILFINDNPITHYTFKHNYYVMMGDNRHQSQDFRQWGFIREEWFLGKVAIKL